MSKPRHRAIDYSVYLALRCLVCVIQALPPGGRDMLVSCVAWLAYRLDRRHRAVAHENLRHAFGDQYTEAQRTRLVQAVYRHFAGLLVEIVLLPRKLHVRNWQKHVDLSDSRSILTALLSDRPLLIVTGHFGNWELAGYVLGLLGFRTYAIARPIDNPYLDRYLRRFREVTGQQILAKQGDFDRMQAILAGGGVLATLADQDAGPRGLFVDFFGRPAATHKAIALLALEYRVPLLVVGAAKIGAPMRYRMTVGQVIYPEAYDGRSDAVRAMTQDFTSALEGLIRQHPEQYFWLHRRWKHQPPKARRQAA